MAGKNQLVSVIVPMHNAENYICKTLVSILRETEIPLEVIVVNDKSTDASLERVLEFSDDRIRVIEGPGRGAAAAMNTGFAESRGEFVMHCDADDLYSDGRIRRQVAWLRRNPEYAAVCGSFSTIDSNDRPVSNLSCGMEPVELTSELREGVVRTSLGTYAIRRELMNKAGGFREYFESSYDIDMQLRFCELGRIAYVPEVFYLWRLHASSITHRQDNTLREFFEQTARDFQRQRQTNGVDDLQKGCPPVKPVLDSRAAKLSASAHIQGLLLGRAWRENAQGRKLDALRTGLRALTAGPGNFQVWRSVLALLMKPAKEPRKR